MTQYIYIAIIVSILYVLLKLVLEKSNKDQEKDKKIFRDSFYIGLIVITVLYGYDYYFSNRGEKTKVFTNEPDF
jgi:4-hydroxybenzoate polyprenyltransferase